MGCGKPAGQPDQLERGSVRLKKRLDFAYDYQGRRVQKIVSVWNGLAYAPQSTNRFVYDGWNLIGMLDAQSSILQSFTWGLDLSGSLQGAGGVGGLVSMTVYSGTNVGTYFYSFDGNGNVAALVNAADGTVSANYEYDPFGQVIRATGLMAKANPFRFSTKFQDDETGLNYYGYRYYNSITGRWPNRDPIGERGGKNVYAFVGNAPTFRHDVLGLICDKCTNGYVRYVHYAGYSLTVYDLGGSPGTLEAAYSAYDNARVFNNISSFANIVTGLAAEEVVKAVSLAAAKVGISKGSKWNWSEAIMNQLNKIKQDTQKQYGVDLWVKIDWQKCEETDYKLFGSDYGHTGLGNHLDWVQQKNVWYKSTLSGANRPEGGFDWDDTQGILNAVPPTIIEAIPALVQ